MQKLKKGDEIIVTAGKDKGKRGKIGKIFTRNNLVLVPEINIFKRHLKKRNEKSPGGIIDFARPLTIANVALICPKCNKQARVGFFRKDGKKMRICKKCSAQIN